MLMMRHLLSILLMPFMVVAGVPYWLLTAFADVDHRWNDGSLIALLPRCAGAVSFLSGFALFSWCVGLFARVGQGTLAPWDPTRNLVAVGPYRFVRNPMISGVALMLFGEGLFEGSWVLGIWACVFLSINHIYFVLSEEPGLERRFGESYRIYKANVPRWIPRMRSRKGDMRRLGKD
jgi:protein-S-isoprenylcysteine O-methyltransferase Ste14